MGILYGIFVNNYKMGVVAMLFGTGELMLAVAMNGTPQIGMFLMAGFSYIVMALYFKFHQIEQNSYMSTFANPPYERSLNE